MSVWPYWLGASAVAICTAEAAFKLASGPERYEQFTVGGLTWRAATKHADYTLLLGLLGGFTCAWLAILLTERIIERRLVRQGVDDFRALITYSTLPLIIWASGLVLGTSSSRALVWLSAIAIAVAIGLTLNASRGQVADTEATPGEAAGFVMLAMTFAALSPLIAVYALNRVLISTTHAFHWTGTPGPLLLASAGSLLGLLLGLWAWRRTYPRSDARLGVMLCIAQLVLPWGFLVVVPVPWTHGEFVRFAGPVGAIPWLVFVLVAAAYVDVIRRGLALRRDAGSRPSRSALQALSPLTLAAALLFIKLAPISIRQLNPDDYHFGEYLLPWWSLHFGAVPFWDYVPARGLINYLDAGIAALSFGTSAAGIAAAIGLVSALVLIVSLISMSSWIGLLPAATAFLLLPLDAQLTQVDALNTSALLLLFAARTRLRATSWLVLWTVVGTVAFLTAPAQGTILVLATIPMGIWQFMLALTDERPRLLRVGAAAGIVAAVLLLVSPLGRMIVGAIRYAREHSAVSGPAHGFEWVLSAGATMPLNRWLFEAVRASWVIVGMCAIALLLSAWVRRDSERRNALVLVGFPIIIMAVFFIYRAAGRIDPGWVSRLGYVSVWMIALMLPILLHAAWGSRSWPVILTLTVAASGLFVPQLGGILTLQGIGHRALESEPHPTGLVRGFNKDFANIGRVSVVKAERFADIGQELGVLLEPTETYLDLTNRNAEYFYLGREVPIESGAIYNLPNDRQQLRSIDRLRARQIPAVLALADSQVYHAAPPSYRVYAIYRYLISRYSPVMINKKVYLLLPDRMRRLDSHPEFQISRSDPADLLDRVFRLPDLQGLPASWGASWASLAAQVSPVRQLGEATRVLNARALGAGTYSADGPDASLKWDLSPAATGKDAGILTFNFSCAAEAKDRALEVRWAAPGAQPDALTTVRFIAAPRVVVPLDAAPRWLLAPAIGSLEIRVSDPGACRQFSVSDVALWQRNIAATTDVH